MLANQKKTKGFVVMGAKHHERIQPIAHSLWTKIKVLDKSQSALPLNHG
jgi:hypothetical protein